MLVSSSRIAARFLFAEDETSHACSLMSRLAHLLMVWATICLPLSRADSAIEGVVQLPLPRRLLSFLPDTKIKSKVWWIPLIHQRQ